MLGRRLATPLILVALGLPSASQELPYYRNIQGGPRSFQPNIPPVEPNEPGDELSLAFQPSGTAFVVGDLPAGSFVPKGASLPVSYGSTGLPLGVTVSSDGALTGAFRAAGTYSGTVTVQDRLNRSASAGFAIEVLPVTVSANLPASARALSPVSGNVGASAGGGWTYSISGAPGTIVVDPATGAISGTTGAAEGSFTLVPRAQRNGVTVTGDSITFAVTSPQFTVSGIPSSIKTGELVSGHAEGADPGTYALADAPAWMSIDANGVISGKVPASPTSGNWNVKVNGSREGLPLLPASFQFGVAPAYHITIPELTTVYRSSYLVLQPGVTGASGHTPTFSKLTGPSFVSVDPSTGAVTFATDNTSSGNYQYSIGLVDANDGSGNSTSSTVYVGAQTLGIQAPAEGASLAWHVGSQGSFTASANFAVSWSRTKPPFTAIVQGPPWIFLSPSGSITAETSQPRSSEPVTIYAYDTSSGQFAGRTLNVSVAASPLAATGVQSVDVHVSSDISARPFSPVVSGALGSTTWTLAEGSLPAGTSVQGPTGRLVGQTSASSAGTYSNLRLRVADADGTSVETEPFTVVVHPALTVTANTTSYSFDAGSAVTTEGINVANAHGSRILSVETMSGTAPAFTLNQATGALSYTAPAGGTWVYRLRAEDDAGGDAYSAHVTASYVTTELASTAVPLTVNGAPLAANTYYSLNGQGNFAFPSRGSCSSSSGASRWIVYDFGKPVQANSSRVYVRMSGGASWHGVEGSNNGTNWTRVWGYNSINYPNSSYGEYTNTFTAVSYRYWAFSTCGSDGTLGRFKLRYNGVTPNF